MTAQFGTLLRELRLRGGWTQEELAEKSGVSAHTINVLEAGRRHPRLSSVSRLATALGLDQAERDRLIAAARAEADGSKDRPADEATPLRAHSIAQLPMGVLGFTGRGDVLSALASLLGAGSGLRGQVPVAVVVGGGGLGKTTLAVHAAHLIADRFPDGQFYADLRAADPVPCDPGEVLAGWLRALGRGVDPASGTSERSANWRSAVHDRRVLIVLDNAKDVHQVLPFLPSAPGCGVIVTSRSRLEGIAGARMLALAPLSPREGLELLAARIGPERVAGDLDAALDVVRACGGIPLAVQIAAARLDARANWPIAELGLRLRDERRRLDELAVGDLAVRASFYISYTALPQAAGLLSPAHAFRLLGLAPGPDFSLPAAAALLGTTSSPAQDALEALVDAQLLESHTPGRYRLHDLLRLYATELAQQEEPPHIRREASRRIVDWYAARATDTLLHLRLQQPLPTQREPISPGPALADRAALTWFETEQPNVIAALDRAIDDAFDTR